MIRRRRIAASIAWLVLIVSMPALDRVASAQTIDPTRAEFVASSDHDVILSNGTAAVTRYEPRVLQRRCWQPLSDRLAWQAYPCPRRDDQRAAHKRSHLASIAGHWSTRRGSPRSDRAELAEVRPHTFSFSSPPCTVSISPTTQSIAPGGGTGSVIVTAGPGCAWTAVDNATWISITAGSTGTGNGTVNYSVMPDVTASARTATLTVAG
jgi:hypothetical protein